MSRQKRSHRGDVIFAHRVQTIELPTRVVTAQEWNRPKAQVEKYSQDPSQVTLKRWHQRVVDQFEQQRSGQDQPVRHGACT